MDYEDYDEMEAISSDDIYYDAGQAQLMGSSNIEKERKFKHQCNGNI